MEYAILIYETPEAFARRENGDDDPYLGAWRAYHKALVEAGVYRGGNPLNLPETGTTIRVKDGRRQIRLCYAKKMHDLEEACRRIRALKTVLA